MFRFTCDQRWSERDSTGSDDESDIEGLSWDGLLIEDVNDNDETMYIALISFPVQPIYSKKKITYKSQGQDMIGSFGLACVFRKPKPPQAKPKPWLSNLLQKTPLVSLIFIPSFMIDGIDYY